MAKFTLNIEMEDAKELAELALKLAGTTVATVRHEWTAGYAEQDAARNELRRAASLPEEPAAAEAQTGTATEPARRGRPRKAAGEAAPAAPVAEEAKPVTADAGEPAASAAAPAGTASLAEASALAQPATQTTTEPVTYETLKGLVTAIIDKHSARHAQEVLDKNCGVKSLTQLPQDKYADAAAALRAALA